MTPFQPRTDILQPHQLHVWRTLAWTRSAGLVLYGGTAVALRYGHRASVDFDFFTDRQIDHRFITQQFLRTGLAFAVIQDQANSFTLQSQPGDVRTSFFGNIDFGRVGVPDQAEGTRTLVSSPLDLLATKLKTILERAQAKDYVDIAELVRQGTDIRQGLAAAQTLYGPEFAPAESVRALSYFADGDLPKVDKTIQKELVSLANGIAKDPRLPVLVRASTGLAIDEPRREPERRPHDLER